MFGRAAGFHLRFTPCSRRKRSKSEPIIISMIKTPTITPIGNQRQRTVPQPSGSAARRRTEARVRPVTKIQPEKKSGVGQTSDFGYGMNFGGFKMRFGPKTSQQKRSGPTRHSVAICSAVSLPALVAPAIARCCA